MLATVLAASAVLPADHPAIAEAAAPAVQTSRSGCQVARFDVCLRS